MSKSFAVLKYGTALALLGYCNERTYIIEVGIKRSIIALYHEFKIFVNYKMVI